MNEIKIITEPIAKKELEAIAREGFGAFVKAVVDVEKKIMAINAELHADLEAMLLEQGSRQEHLWGINLYPEKSGEAMIEFNSMINIRPSAGNNSRGVENEAIREKIRQVIRALVSEK